MKMMGQRTVERLMEESANAFLADPAKKKRTRYVKLRGGTMLEVVRETKATLVGFKVNRSGERIERVTKKHVEQFMHVTKPGEIVSELAMNRKYAELEPVDPTNADQLGNVRPDYVDGLGNKIPLDNFGNDLPYNPDVDVSDYGDLEK